MLLILIFCILLPLGLSAQQTVQDWQAVAIRDYPDLKVQGSALHKRYIDAYKEKQASSPGFFTDPYWPVQLANEVNFQKFTGPFGGKAIKTKYVGTEDVLGQSIPYDRTAEIEMVVTAEGPLCFFYAAPDSKADSFPLWLSKDEASTFETLLEKAMDWQAIAEKEQAKSYAKGLGSIGSNKFSFVRSMTGETHIAIILDEEGKSPKLTGQIQLQGMAASLALLKVRQAAQDEKMQLLKQRKEDKIKADGLFK